MLDAGKPRAALTPSPRRSLNKTGAPSRAANNPFITWTITPSATLVKTDGFINGTITVTPNGTTVTSVTAVVDGAECPASCQSASPNTAFQCTFVNCPVANLADRPVTVTANAVYGAGLTASGATSVQGPGTLLSVTDDRALLTGARRRVSMEVRP